MAVDGPPASSSSPSMPDGPAEPLTTFASTSATPTASPPAPSSSSSGPAAAAAAGGAQPAAGLPPPPGLGGKTSKKYEPLSLPTSEQIQVQDMMDNCLAKGVLSAVMGGLLGGAFGVFSASIDNAGGGLDHVAVEQKTTRVVLKEMWLNMKTKSVSFAKGFAAMGALYSFNECVIEKWRGSHDKVNPALAGCATGGMLAYSAGPKAMCIGCASFGAFSLAIEYFMDT